MSIPVQNPIAAYTGNGSATQFAYNWYLVYASDIAIQIEGVTVPSNQYTVTGIGNVTGGNVVFNTAPATGARILMQRDVPLERLTNYIDNGDLLAQTVNADFDRIWMALQDVNTISGYALRVADKPIPFIPQNAADRAGKVLTADVNGNPVFTVPASGSAADVLAQLGSPLPGKGASLVSLENGNNLQQEIVSIENDALTSELNSRAALFNRQSVEVCRVSPPSTMPTDKIGYNQALYVDAANLFVYTTYDPDNGGTKYIKKSSLISGAELAVTTVIDGRVNHLDSLHINPGAGTARVTGTVSNPAILDIDLSSGNVINSIVLSKAHSSSGLLLAVDPSFTDSFVIWGVFEGSPLVKIYKGVFSDVVDGKVQIHDTGIAYPQGTILQGLALLNNRVYALCGAGGVGDKQLFQWRSSGELQAQTVVRPDATYAAVYGGVYEPEGLHVISERQNDSNAVNLYMGWTFGDGTKAGSFCSVFRYANTQSRQAFTVDGYAGRQTGSLSYQLKDIIIRLRRTTTGWEIEQGDFLSALTNNTINSLAVASDTLSINFNLKKPYQDVLGWSIAASPELARFGRVIPVWVFKTGGDTSMTGQQIRFVGIDSSIYAPVNGATIQEGVRVSLMLKVIQ